MHKAKPKQANCLLGLHPTSTQSGHRGYCLAIVAPPLLVARRPISRLRFGAPLLRNHYCPIMTLMSNTIFTLYSIF